jgi:hypothetical protein
MRVQIAPSGPDDGILEQIAAIQLRERPGWEKEELSKCEAEIVAKSQYRIDQSAHGLTRNWARHTESP